jgi:hypothetical protein
MAQSSSSEESDESGRSAPDGLALLGALTTSAAPPPLVSLPLADRSVSLIVSVTCAAGRWTRCVGWTVPQHVHVCVRVCVHVRACARAHRRLELLAIHARAQLHVLCR